MRAYYDTSVLVKLYVEEDFSDSVTAYVAERGKPLLFNAFHDLETENALRLKLFRKEIDQVSFDAVLSMIAQDLAAGRLVRKTVDWGGAISEAKRVAVLSTGCSGCRTLDVLHVGIARHWGCDLLVSVDDRQIRAAEAVGLRPVDIRNPQS